MHLLQALVNFIRINLELSHKRQKAPEEPSLAWGGISNPWTRTYMLQYRIPTVVDSSIKYGYFTYWFASIHILSGDIWSLVRPQGKRRHKATPSSWHRCRRDVSMFQTLVVSKFSLRRGINRMTCNIESALEIVDDAFRFVDNTFMLSNLSELVISV